MTHHMLKGFHPFWFWNGKIDEEGIRAQVTEMADKGIRGFFIHSRQGLDVPYLSDRFLDLVAFAVEEARRLGMTAHLYDEYPYPSGVAGGLAVMGDPGHLGTRLVHFVREIEGGAPLRFELPEGKLLRAAAYPIRDEAVDWDSPIIVDDSAGVLMTERTYHETGLTSYNRKRFLAAEPRQYLELRLPAGRYRLTAAVQQIITDNKYFGRFIDPYNPDAVKAFIRITHERYKKRIGGEFGSTVRMVFTDETAGHWSPRLVQPFEQRFGYSLIDSLPAFLNEDHPDHLAVSRDLRLLSNELFVESFDRPIARWCGENRLLYCAEKPAYSLSHLAEYGVPGCEPGHTKAGDYPDLLGAEIRQNAKAAASAAYFFGKPGAACESYHSIGWSATLQDAKAIAEGLLLLGVETIVPHGFFYTTGGLAKHDAPPSLFVQMPYWPLFGALSCRVDEILDFFDGCVPTAEVWVYEPSAGIPNASQRKVFQRIQHSLMEIHREFLLVDLPILLSRDRGAALLVIPPVRLREPGLDDAIATWKSSGGEVVEADETFDREGFEARVVRDVDSSLPGTIAGVDGGRRLWVTRRKARNGETRRMLLNTADVPVTLEPSEGACFTEAAEGRLIRTGRRRVIAPFESVLLRDGETGGTAARCEPLVIDVPREMTVRPLTPNFYRAGKYSMSFRTGKGDAWTDAGDVEPKPVVNQLADRGAAYTPEYRFGFGRAPRLEFPAMTVRYTHSFAFAAGSGAVTLVIEPEGIRGDWVIGVNGGREIAPADLTEAAGHMPGCRGIDITESLRAGANTVELEVAVETHDDGLVAPLYLAGTFGVDRESGLIGPASGRGRFEEYDANGLPYFSGALEYGFDTELPAGPGTGTVPVELRFPSEFTQACTLSLNGGEPVPYPWQPYIAAVPTADIREGTNRVRLVVYTSLIRSYEGSDGR